MSRKPREIESHPSPFPGGVFRAFCTNVVDGDTIDCFVDLGFLQYAYVVIRLKDVDTPEIFRPKSDEERVAGFEAKGLVETLVLGAHVLLHTEPDRTTFGRFVAYVKFMKDGTWHDLGHALRTAGFDWSNR